VLLKCNCLASIAVVCPICHGQGHNRKLSGIIP